MAEPKYVAETLAWCNSLRKKDGKPPLKRMPKGRKMDPSSCPCGKACGWDVFTTFAARNKVRVLMPESVIDFVAAFDNGRLPQYEIKCHGRSCR